jgi:hypothetical protein
MEPSWPWFVGACYDIVGALLLARALLAATSRDLLANASSGFSDTATPIDPSMTYPRFDWVNIITYSIEACNKTHRLVKNKGACC